MSLDFDACIASLGVPLKLHPHGQWTCDLDPWADRARQSVTREEGIYLSQWATGLRVLEIGTGIGVSTVCLASTALEVVTVDPDEWTRSNLKLPANTRQLASFSEVQGEFDLAFIDGLHDTASVKRDIEDCLGVVRSGGHLSFHDVNQPDVKAAVDSFRWKSREQMKTVGHLTRCGVA